MIRNRALGVWPRFLGAALLIVGSCVAVAAQSNPNGPSMEVTAAWLESDGVALMQTSRVLRTDLSAGVTWVEWSGVPNLTLNGCLLTYSHKSELRRVSKGRTVTEMEHSRRITVPLEDLDVDGILARWDGPTSEVQLRLNAGAPHTILAAGGGGIRHHGTSPCR